MKPLNLIQKNFVNVTGNLDTQKLSLTFPDGIDTDLFWANK